MATNKGTLETLIVTAESDISGVWSGMPIAQALPIYKELYGLGTLSTAHFGVTLEPFDLDGDLAKSKFSGYLPLGQVGNSTFSNQVKSLSEGELDTLPIFLDEYQLPFLATGYDLSLLDAQVDSMNVGAHQFNYLTGNGSGDMSITFIETRNVAILNSAKIIKSVMFNKDGTQKEPFHYLMRLTAFIYDKFNFGQRVFELEHIVKLQTASIPLESSNSNGVGTVTLNFTKMFPNLKNEV